jgi:hypothetical protein
MAMSDLTVEILKQIRDEICATNTRLDATNTRLDATNTRLDETRVELSTRLGRLEQRQTEMEVRLATELVATVGAINNLRDAVLQGLAEGRQVIDHERRITALEKRVG